MKKNHKFSTLFWNSFILLILLSACNNERDVLEKPESWDLVSSAKNDKPFKLSSFASNIEYIPLETNDSCYLGRISQIDVFGNNVFILDDHHQLFRFNRDGDFVSHIGKQGEGPGEHMFALSFALFPKKKVITVFDALISKVILYSFSGEFIREFKVVPYPSEIGNLNNDYIVVLYTFPEFVNNDNYGLSIYDFEGKLLSKLLNRKDETEKSDFQERSKMREGRVMLMPVSDTLTYWEYGLDYLYKIPDKDTIIERYHLNYGAKAKILAEGEIDDKSLWIGQLIETDNYLFCSSCVLNNKIKSLIYNKGSGLGYNMMTHQELNLNMQLKAGFINDIDGAWPIAPKIITSEQSLLHYFNAYEFTDHLNTPFFKNINYSDQHKRDELNRILEQSTPIDNPIIMIVTQK